MWNSLLRMVTCFIGVVALNYHLQADRNPSAPQDQQDGGIATWYHKCVKECDRNRRNCTVSVSFVKRSCNPRYTPPRRRPSKDQLWNSLPDRTRDRLRNETPRGSSRPSLIDICQASFSANSDCFREYYDCRQDCNMLLGNDGY